MRLSKRGTQNRQFTRNLKRRKECEWNWLMVCANGTHEEDEEEEEEEECVACGTCRDN
jgi:ferredoxin-like protein FixX